MPIKLSKRARSKLPVTDNSFRARTARRTRLGMLMNRNNFFKKHPYSTRATKKETRTQARGPLKKKEKQQTKHSNNTPEQGVLTKQKDDEGGMEPRSPPHRAQDKPEIQAAILHHLFKTTPLLLETSKIYEYGTFAPCDKPNKIRKKRDNTPASPT